LEDTAHIVELLVLPECWGSAAIPARRWSPYSRCNWLQELRNKKYLSDIDDFPLPQLE